MQKRIKPRSGDPISRYIGGRIVTRRKLLGFSQDALAKALGITFQQIQKYEKGENRIPSNRLWQVSQALAIAPSYFFEGLKKGQKPPIIIDEPTPSEIALVRDLRALPNEKARNYIISLIKTLAQN